MGSSRQPNQQETQLLLQEFTVKAINQILTERKVFLGQLQANITKAVVSADTLSPDGIQARLEELQEFIAKQKTDITEFDEVLVNKLIEKITVFADHFTVEFKSGLTIEIKA